MQNTTFSPRMWRWSPTTSLDSLEPYVFSTYVEVILISASFAVSSSCFLHVCGGDPISKSIWESEKTFSPRMWRWSSLHAYVFFYCFVFSTYVEVIPTDSFANDIDICFLHVCGGDPEPLVGKPNKWVFSPRMWRWSSCIILKPWKLLGFLHVCGGDPD